MTLTLILTLFIAVYFLWKTTRSFHEAGQAEIERLVRRVSDLEQRVQALIAGKLDDAQQSIEVPKQGMGVDTTRPLQIEALESAACEPPRAVSACPAVEPPQEKLPDAVAVGIQAARSEARPTDRQAVPATKPQPPQSVSKGSDWESALGGKWLHKIGVSVLVVGLSFMLAYAFDAFGAFGKIALAYLAALILFFLGSKLEKTRPYRAYAWSLLAGAWATGYFTTYGLHFVGAMRLIDSQWLGLTVLGLYTGAMILYSLRFNSQVVTGLAAFIGYCTVTLSGLEAFSMISILLLSIFLVITGTRLHWHYLPMIGVFCTYCLHIWWELGTGLPGSQLPWWILLLIISYWMIFLPPTFFPRDPGNKDLEIRVASTAANGLGLVATLTVHFHGEHLFYALLFAGAAYAVLSLIASRLGQKCRPLFQTLVTLASGILFVSIPLKLTGDTLTLVWIFEAEMLILLGFRLRDDYFKILGFGGLVIATALATVLDQMPLTLIVVALVHYGNWFFDRPRSLRILETVPGGIFSWMSAWGAVLIMKGLWVQFSYQTVPIAWLGFAVLLFAAGLVLKAEDLCLQAAGVSLPLILLNVLNLLVVGSNVYVISALSTAAFLYLVDWRVAPRMLKQESVWERELIRAFGYPATVLLTLAAWRLFPEVTLPAVLVGLAFGHLLVGTRLPAQSTRIQGVSLILLAAIWQCWNSALLTETSSDPTLRRLVAVLALAGVYFFSLRMADLRAQKRLTQLEGRLVEGISYSATLATAVVTLHEVPDLWIPVVWVVGAVLSLVVGVSQKNLHYGRKACLLFCAAVVRVVLFNLVLAAASPARLWSLILFVMAGLAFYAVITWAMRNSRAIVDDSKASVDILAGPMVASSVSLVLLALTCQEVDRGLLTLIVALEGLALFSVGLLVRGRELRFASLGFLGFCLGKVLFIDLSGAETLDRIFSFIGLGLVLIAVSYLYIRFGGWIRKYL
ncbi:MAG: DUF2339 domain-containing protein [Acidobacteriota bacterium]|nr:MAG: DUF2339 domain-containing protein [Acidobacteriota bacterium]